MESETIFNERKQWKKRAKTVVKRHYVLFVILCLVAIFYGTEFNYVVTHADDTYRFLTSMTLGAEDNSLMGVAKEMLAGVDEDAAEEVEELQKAGNEISSDIMIDCCTESLPPSPRPVIYCLAIFVGMISTGSSISCWNRLPDPRRTDR